MKKFPKKAVIFVLLTFLLSWSLTEIFFFGDVDIQSAKFFTVSIIYMFMPMISAIIVQKLVFHESIIKPFEISLKFNNWFIVAWLLPLVFVFMAMAISLLMPEVQFTSDPLDSNIIRQMSHNSDALSKMKQQAESLPLHPFWMSLLTGLLAGFTVNALAAFGEEVGWRGILQNELSATGFWKSSFVTGIIWGIWHAPIILRGYSYPGNPAAGVFMMIALCILLSPIFSYMRIKSGSVLAPAVIHGSFNAFAGLPMMMLKGGEEFLVGMTGLSGIISLLIINILLFLYIKQSQSRSEAWNESVLRN